MINVHLANSITRDNRHKLNRVARHGDPLEARLFADYSTAIASGDRTALANAWQRYIVVAVPDPRVRASIPLPRLLRESSSAESLE